MRLSRWRGDARRAGRVVDGMNSTGFLPPGGEKATKQACSAIRRVKVVIENA